MAIEAAFALHQRIVFKACFFGLYIDILVAFEAQGIARFVEQEAVIRAVGIVAGLAVAFDDHLMNAARLIRHDLLMATAAKRIGVQN